MLTKSWNEYYSNKKHPLSNIFLHIPYIAKIILTRPRSIMEIGCGPAQHILFVKKILKNTKIYVLDLDKELLDRVKTYASDSIEDYLNVDILDHQRISTLPKVDLIISQGLMEHFGDKEFLEIINNFAPVAKKMLFSVPSDKYKNQDFGNEQLRSKFQIDELLRTSGYKYSVNNYFIDLGIRTKLNLINQYKFDIKSSINLLFRESCHLLVEIDYTKQR